MSNNSDMIKLVKLFESQQKFAGEEVGQKPGDQVRGTDKAKVGGKDHPFKGRLVGEDTALEDVLSKKYQDFKDVQAKEKEKKKEKEELDEVAGETPEKEIERLKLRQNAWKKAPLRDQAATQARIRELEKQIKDKKGVAEGFLDHPVQEDSPVTQAITRRILMQRTDLLSKYGPEKVASAIDEVADFVGDVDEIGSSDVSGWIRHVERLLSNDVEEAAPPLVRAAAGLGMGALSGTGGGILGSTLGPILGTAFAAYAGYQGAKLGMQAADDIWDWAARKFGSEDRAEDFVMAHARAAAQGQPQFSYNGKEFKTTLKPEQAKSAVQAVKQVSESRRVSEAANPTDTITVDVPLMLRIMEYAREDAKDDMDLHDVTERLVKLSASGKALGMKDYDAIVGATVEGQINEFGAEGSAIGNVAQAKQMAVATKPTTSPSQQPQANTAPKTSTTTSTTSSSSPTTQPGQEQLNPDEQDALDKIMANAGLKSQLQQLMQKAKTAPMPSSGPTV